MGQGSFNTISSKQKLNTRSSTEAELVAADDIAPQAIWTMNFLYEQGYQCETTVYQDNTSAMLLEKNGMESSSKRTRHINIRYYLIKDKIEKGDLCVEYCPTDDMLADSPTRNQVQEVSNDYHEPQEQQGSSQTCTDQAGQEGQLD